MTVAELGCRMSSTEFTQWVAHDDLCAEERAAAKLKAGRG